MREALAVARYEYRMQIRRPGLWIGLLVLTGFFYALSVIQLQQSPGSLIAQPWHQAFRLIFPLNLLTPVAAGILVADRFPRDTLLRMRELLRLTRLSPRSLIFGKYMGSLLAVLTPSLLLLLGIVTYLALRLNLPLLYLAAPVTFLAIGLPTWLFFVAWSLVFPLVMPLRLYQVLFGGFWLWAVAVPPTRLPTINQSIFDLKGSYVLRAFFSTDAGSLNPPATAGWAVFNISLLLGLTMVALVAMVVILRRQEAVQ